MSDRFFISCRFFPDFYYFSEQKLIYSALRRRISNECSSPFRTESLEYGEFVAAPYCGKLLADLGAEVIKVEKPVTATAPAKTARFPRINRISKKVVYFCI